MIIAAILLAAAAPAAGTIPVAEPTIVTTASGLRFQALKAGSGGRPVAGDAVLLTYEGRLVDGTLFDAPPEPVGLGVSDVIPGFSEALLLMNEGGTYRFRIPAALAYGAEGTGDGMIPPNADLDFTVTLHEIARPAAPESLSTGN